MTEHRPPYGGFGEPLDLEEKLITEQAECAVTKARLAEALAGLRNIRGMIAGRATVTGWDDGGRQAGIDAVLLDEIDDQCEIILEVGDVNDNPNLKKKGCTQVFP